MRLTVIKWPGRAELGRSTVGEALDLTDLAALLRGLSRPEADEALRQLRDVPDRGPSADHPLITAALAGNGIEL